jgi:hypothetical protein
VPFTSRRSFLAGLAGAGAALPVFSERAVAQLFKAETVAGGRTAAALADDESYWGEIQRAFDLDRTMINLNNGGVCPSPTHVLEQMIRDLRFSNELPVYHMWNVLEPRIESVRRDLAADFGCDPEEMAITRNASEALETLILGRDLQPGDEVLVTNQNYGRMLTTWEQRVRREGIVLKQVSFDVRNPSPAYLVDVFRKAITPRTKILEVTHITNLTGQIFPVREVIDMARRARRRGVRGRGARVRALPLHARRPQRGLLRHLAAQVAAGPDRHRLPLRAQGQDRRHLADDGGLGRDERQHPEVRGDRHPPRRPTTTRSPRPSPSTTASAASARSPGSASSAIAGPRRSSPSRRG